MNVIDVCDFIKVIGVFKKAKCVYSVQNVMVDIFWSFFIQYFTVNFFFLQDHFLKQGFDGTNHTAETLSFDLLKASIQYLIFLKAFYVCLYLIS